jgi:energy-coupling factor transporter transmembrane protein EcfT
MLYSSAIAIIGFLSMVLSVYIGDTFVRVSLLGIGFIFIGLLYFSYSLVKSKRQLTSLLIFTIITFCLAFLVPSFPPLVELRPYEIDASILKFFIASFTMVLVGIAGGALSFKPMYKFTSRSSERSAYYVLIVSILLVIYYVLVMTTSQTSKVRGVARVRFPSPDLQCCSTALFIAVDGAFERPLGVSGLRC